MESLEILKKHIREICSDINFVHREWFIKYHIEIAEKIALELCGIYLEADKDLTIALVWFHDYGKIIDFQHEHEATQEKGFSKLVELGFKEDLARKVIEGIDIIDKKISLQAASTEVKIASSADGASHLVGPFYPLYWKEHPDMGINEILVENRAKLEIDWNKKIILPEVRNSFLKRYNVLKELFGELPSNLLDCDAI